MPPHNNDRIANLNTLLISVASALFVGLFMIVGYFAKTAFETINAKLDSHTAAQGEIQTDVTTIKTQLPFLTARVDKLETSQHDMWQRFGVDPADKPSMPSINLPKQP